MSVDRAPTSRRGFAMAFVLLLALVASLLIGVALSRQNAQALSVERQVDDYQANDDMLGARAVVEQWLRGVTPADLDRLSKSKDEAYRFVIVDHMTISLTIEDGQGRLLASSSLAPEAMRDQYDEILDRLPEDRRGLVRTFGPAQVSVRSAPFDVLAALLDEGGAGFAEEVIAAREEEPLTDGSFYDLLRASAAGPRAVDRLQPLITFQPSIWRIRIKMTDQKGDVRRYEMLAELGQNTLVVHEWIGGADLILADKRAARHRADRAGASRRSRARRRKRNSERGA